MKRLFFAISIILCLFVFVLLAISIWPIIALVVGIIVLEDRRKDRKLAWCYSLHFEHDVCENKKCFLECISRADQRWIAEQSKMARRGNEKAKRVLEWHAHYG